jgi:hypothetical protein
MGVMTKQSNVVLSVGAPPSTETGDEAGTSVVASVIAPRRDPALVRHWSGEAAVNRLARGTTALAWLVFVTFAALYASSAGARGYSVDGDFAYRLARDLVNRGPVEAFGAQRELLRRWGPGLPLLSTPLVGAGTAIAGVLPPAGSVPLNDVPGASRTIVAQLADWPPISRDATNGPGDAHFFNLAIPIGTGPIGALTVVSSLAFAGDLPDGAVVATLSVKAVDGTTIGAPMPLRAGLDTAEWSWGDPARPPVAHRLAPVAGRWDGNADAKYFRATLLASDSSATARTVRVEQVTTTGRLLVGAVIASTPDGVLPLTLTTSTNGPQESLPGLVPAETTTADRVTRAAFGFANVIPGAATVALMVPVAFAYGARPRAAITLAALTGLATLTWPYARLDFAESLAGACALGALAARLSAAQASRTPRQALALNVVAGALAVGAGVAKYTALWFAPLVVIDALLTPGVLPRMRVAALFFFPGATVVIIALSTGIVAPRIIAELPDGLSRGWLGYPLWAGLLSLVASSGKGLLWYAPPFALSVVGAVPFARRYGAAAFLPFAAPATYLLVFGSKGNWHGGGWGPRYLVPMVPFAMVVSLPVIQRAFDARAVRQSAARFAVAASLIAGLGVNALAILKHPNSYTIMFRDHIAPQLAGYGVGQGGFLARAYVEYFRREKVPSELVRPPGTPTDIHGTPLPERGLGHLIDRDSPLIVKFWPARPERFALTLYFCNYDGPADVPRHQNVTVVDAYEAQTLRIEDFSGGIYATWAIDAVPDEPIIVAAYDSGRAFPIISGIFFDPLPVGDRPLPTLDRKTGGAWVGRYGREGAVLPAYEMGPRDAGALPSYISTFTGGTPVWVDTGELERSEAALLYAPGFSPIPAHAWLLGNDLIAALFPANAPLRQKALASPPWRYVHGLEIHSPHPEYGLGIDLWPFAMRDWFASWPGVMAAIWAFEGALAVITFAGSLGIGLAWARSVDTQS